MRGTALMTADGDRSDGLKGVDIAGGLIFMTVLVMCRLPHVLLISLGVCHALAF